ncbi:MAG TPA: heparan-alpha-glucosaminide N-acetyltransferase domain-containing protein [Leptolyngbyaceae cyanobacterium]
MRLISLDVFRGIAIAAMILVNMAGLTDRVHPFLQHSDWHGCTPADLVFPFFLFIMGVGISFSFYKYTKGKRPDASVYRRIITRSIILFALGLFLNSIGNYDISQIRIMGVLQRISLTYLITTIAVIHFRRQWRWILAFTILIGYWLAMTYIPVPGYGAGILTREGNLGAYLDRIIIGTAHLYQGDNYNSMGDPEGLFSTLPALVNVLAGYFTGRWLRREPIDTRTSINLALIGIICLIIGWDWGFLFPLNKKLWTSSYVLYSTGWSILFMAACHELFEVRDLRSWGKPFQVLGLNAIFIFISSVLAIKILVKTHIGTGENAPTIYNWISQHFLIPWAGETNSSLLLALLTLLFWWGVAYFMYWRSWFIKV